MITAEHALTLLTMLAAGGLRDPNLPAESRAQGLYRAMQARLYAAALNGAGVTMGEAESAVLEYAAEPDPGLFPKPWPDPGKLVARTPAARIAATFGSDADADDAWRAFDAGMRPYHNYNRRPADLPFDPDPHRDAAMRAGLTAVGGTGAWYGRLTDDMPRIQRAWRSAYSAARREQAKDGRAVRVALGTVVRRQIAAEAK